MRLMTAVFIALLSATPAFAAELRLVCAELPPYCFHVPPPSVTAVGEREGVAQGLVYDTVREMARRVGQNDAVEFMGWTRAQELARTSQNIGILALTRSPERENSYRWIVPIVSEDLLLVGSAGVDVSALNAVKDRPIGVLKGSGAEQLLRDLRFSRISARAEEWLNARDLKERTIDAWLAPRSMILYGYREVGGDINSLSFGEIVRRSDIYFAGSKNIDEATVARWQKAFEDMRNDETYTKIAERYRRPKVEALPERVLDREPFEQRF